MAIIPYLKFTYVCIKCSMCNQLIELDNTVIYENGKPIICDEVNVVNYQFHILI